MTKFETTIKSFFDFNFAYASVIALFVFCSVYLFLRWKNKRYSQKTSAKVLICGMVLAVYLTLLIGGTILSRSIGDIHDMELMPFWSYRESFVKKDLELLKQIIYNVLVFIPWPILFQLVFPIMRKFSWGVGSAFLFSVFIEVTQLVLKLGLFEFDDMFHNVLGAVIGYYVWKLCLKYKRKGVEE